jgi:hypothetical protein
VFRILVVLAALLFIQVNDRSQAIVRTLRGGLVDEARGG